MKNERIEKAKECKSAEELMALAAENGVELTAEEAAAKFAALNAEGELADEELDAAAGGGCAGEIGKGEAVTLLGGKCPSCGGASAIYLRKIPYDAAPNEYFFRCAACSREFSLRARALSDITVGASGDFGKEDII